MAICFVAGIVPDVALDIIQKLVKAAVGILSFAKDLDPPLTGLQGLNLWHQSRLAEEGIENAQNLAESDICDLIVYTRLGASRLLDWKDQALLCIHAGQDFERYQKAGIHTATEFGGFYEARFKLHPPVKGRSETFPPSPRKFNH